MKRFISVLLVICVALSLAACANEPEGPETYIDSETDKKGSSGTFDFTPIVTGKDTETETVKETETEPPVTETNPPVTETDPPVTETDPPVTEPDPPVTQPDPPTPPPVFDPGIYSSDPLISRMTFFGDSTTYGLKYYGIVADDKVWTPSNGTISLHYATTDYIYDPATGGEYPLAEMCARNKPDILVITLGINGISFMNMDNFKYYYRLVIDTVKLNSPSTKIALQTMYPLSASSDYPSKGIDNTKIANGNQWIREIASEYGIACIDSAPALVNEYGYRPEEWQNGDGLHMSAQGFAAVMDYIIKHPCY